MIHTEEKMVPVVTGFTCDCCGMKFGEDDVLDLQEAHHISFVGGYASIFGDGTKVECDLCQECLHKMIKDVCRTKNAEND
jgi:hypothetical protein